MAYLQLELPQVSDIKLLFGSASESVPVARRLEGLNPTYGANSALFLVG
jgi:hypothetical protein